MVARLGEATQAARVWIAEQQSHPEDGRTRIVFRFAWGAPGVDPGFDDPRIAGGIDLRETGVEHLEAQLRAGRPVVTLVRELPEFERSLPARMGSKSFAVVPIFAGGEWWGFLGFGETRRERLWSAAEVEALKTAAAVIGAAIERERADDALRESEERFQRLSGAAFEGIALTEAGTFIDGNDQLAALLGCPLSELTGRPVRDFVAPEDLELVASRIRSGSEGPYQHMALRADGSRFPVEVRARSLPLRGRTIRVSALRDVSARVEAEERQRHLEAELRRAAEEWRRTFDALDLGILLVDAGGRIVRLNRGALDAIVQASFASAVGMPLEALSGREPWRAIVELHRQVGERRASVVGQARDPSSGRAYYLLGSPWFQVEGEPPWRVITFRDVTEFTTVQEQLRQARAMEAHRLAGRRRRARGAQPALQHLGDASTRSSAVIGQDPGFTEYAALLRSPGRPPHAADARPAGLRPAAGPAAGAGQPGRRRAPRRPRLRRARPPARGDGRGARRSGDLPTLVIDAARLEQALENLMANAIQHSPAGAAVSVAAGRDTADDEGAIWCSVEDDGPGLPAESEGRVFEPFFTRRKGGTGLGLSIVQRLVEAHGGRVSAENRAGGGARFSVRLPVGGAQAPKEARVAERQILVVDDDDDVRLPLRQFLAAKGYAVLEAEDLASLREALSGQQRRRGASWTSRCRTATASTCCAP